MGDLEFNYESNAAASYFVISMEANKEVLKYHVDMIANNKIPSILSFDFRQKDSKLYFYYDITSKLALSEFLKRTRVSREKFLTILWNISKTLLDCRSFLLSDRCFLLEAEHIYINPLSMEVSIVYIPINFSIDVNHNFREFVTKLILGSITFDNSSDNYIQNVLYYLKLEPFNISEFHKVITNMKFDSGTDVCEEIQNESSHDIVRGERDKGNIGFQIPDGINYKTMLIALLFQILIVVVLIFTARYFKNAGKNTSTNYLALAMILIGLEALFMKVIFKKRTAVIEEAEIKVTEKKVKTKGRKEGKKHLDIPGQEDISITSFEQVTPKASYDTTLLGHSIEKHPFLKGDNEGNFEIIEINRSDFLIGRLKEQVDYISTNNAIGKVHAQIITRDNLYYIKDINSRNGTYVNDMRIDGSKEYEIKNNDIIRLANSEYTFIVPQK